MTERIRPWGERLGIHVECELNQFFCVVHNTNGEVLKVFVEAKDVHSLLADKCDFSKVNDSLSWIYSLYFNPISEDFLSQCVRVLLEAAGSPKVTKHAEHIRTTVLEMDNGNWRILIRNLHMNYKRAHIDVGRTIEKLDILNSFPWYTHYTDS